jgi:DNA helicase INO80
MSFASILSEPAEAPSPRRPSPPPLASMNNHREPEPAPVAALPRLEKKPSNEKRRRTLDLGPGLDEAPPQPFLPNGSVESSKMPVQPRVTKVRRTLTERDLETINKIVAEIDKAEKSDVEEPGFEQEWERYIMKGRKRALDAERLEAKRRKVCR